MLLWRHFGLQAIVKYITQIQLFKVLKIDLLRLKNRVSGEALFVRALVHFICYKFMVASLYYRNQL
jgi:hypothetical protein